MHNWISFDLLRTSQIPCTLRLKPEQMYSHAEALLECDWVLFPEYWQIHALAYGYGARLFPSLSSYLIGHNKIEMTRAFRAVAPAHIPETLIHANTDARAEFVWDQMLLPFVAKAPMAAGGEGVWLIENRQDWQAYRQRSDVLYVQEYLPIDRDLRIVIVGREILAAYWRLQSRNGFHNNLARGGEILHGPVPKAALTLALDVAERLGIDHAGFDIAMVGGHPYLLEFNRLFGNRGIPGGEESIQKAISRYLLSLTDPRTPDKPGEQGPDLTHVA